MKKHLKNMNVQNAYEQWLEGSGSFQQFIPSAPFDSLKKYPDFALMEVRVEMDEEYNSIIQALEPHNPGATLFILDLPGVRAVETAYLLQNVNGIKPILIFKNQLHPKGMVGNQEFISALLMCGENLDPGDYFGFAFILDTDRVKKVSEKEARTMEDNRYSLAPGDLPSANQLKKLGYSKVVYTAESNPPEDAQMYLDALRTGGMDVVIQQVTT